MHSETARIQLFLEGMVGGMLSGGDSRRLSADKPVTFFRAIPRQACRGKNQQDYRSFQPRLFPSGDDEEEHPVRGEDHRGKGEEHGGRTMGSRNHFREAAAALIRRITRGGRTSISSLEERRKDLET